MELETTFSTFKRTFGEYCISKQPQNIVKELTIKTSINNMIINI